MYLDPPYYKKGSRLYLNFYDPSDHKKVAAFLRDEHRFLWVMSYDNVPEIRRLYHGMNQVAFDLEYSANNGGTGREIMIYPSTVCFPQRWTRRIPPRYVTAADGVAIPAEG